MIEINDFETRVLDQFLPRPLQPFLKPLSSEEQKIIDAIDSAIKEAGLRGEDASIAIHNTLLKMGLKTSCPCDGIVSIERIR